jgi:drug/metabolite transporter (DMT)-like permease
VASFSFLTPLFAILLGYILYGEPLTLALAVAFLLVASGIILINRRS